MKTCGKHRSRHTPCAVVAWLSRAVPMATVFRAHRHGSGEPCYKWLHPRHVPATLAAVLLLCASIAASAHAEKVEKLDERPPPFETVRIEHATFLRHAGQYPLPSLEWQVDPRVQDPVAVAADPHLPAHMLVVTGQGLVETYDYGRSWKVNAAAAAGKIGPIASILFRPDAPGQYYVGSRTQGLWQTEDGGRTFEQLASKATGLASDSVWGVYLYPADKLQGTLLVVHGDEAPGLSKSVDRGKSWKVLYPQYHVWRIACHHDAREMVFAASAKEQPEIQGLYYLPSLEEPWQALISDTVCTGGTQSLLQRDGVYVATSDKGLFKISRNGGVAKNVGPAGVEWASLGCTWAGTADRELFYGYDPKRLGLVLFTPEQLDGASGDEAGRAAHLPPPYRVQSHGLFTGPLVLEGACVLANANGSQFYAVANKSLYVSRSVGHFGLVRDVAVDPPLRELQPEVVENAFQAIDQALDAFTAAARVGDAAKELRSVLDEQHQALAVQRIAVSAQVDYRPEHPPRSVTVDLSRLGLSERSPLWDDGRHGDRAAGDGLYANTFAFDSLKYKESNLDWRPSWSGFQGLTVSAVAEDGTLSGAVGVLRLVTFNHSLPLFSASAYYPPPRESGDVKCSVFRPRGGSPTACHRVIGVRQAGEWSVRIDGERQLVDISGFYAIGFVIRADRNLTDDLAVQLRDQPTYSLPATTKPVFLLKEKLLRGGKITPAPQQVVVPVSRLLKDSPDFQPDLAHALVLSANASAPVELTISDLRCFATIDDVPASETGDRP